jgi:CRP-like cAMP-binding protein
MKLVRDPKLARIAALPLFAGCSTRELAAVGAAAELVTVPRLTELTLEGTRAEHVYVLLDGMVQVRRGSRVLAYLKDGDVVGELGPLDRSLRTATVTTIVDSDVLIIDRRHLVPLLDRSPDIGARLEAIAAPRRAA